MRAVDSSYDRLTEREAKCLRGSDCLFFIQCLLALPSTGPEQPGYRVESLRNAQCQGLRTGAYIAIGSDLRGAEYVDMARRGVPDDIWDALEFVAVDVEVPGIIEDQIWGALGRLRELNTDWDDSWGLISQAGIYTTYNAWMNYVRPSNPKSFSNAGVWLWNALWDGDPDVDFTGLPFGGWHPSQVLMEQWSGGTNVCGQFVDRNTVVHPEILDLPKEEDMPTAEYEELTERIDGLQELARLGFNGLQSRINSLQGLVAKALPIFAEDLDALEEGATKVPIWPVGEVDLRTIRHRGYYASTQVKKLSKAVGEALRALESHVRVHNQSGCVRDVDSYGFLVEMALILHQLDEVLD